VGLNRIILVTATTGALLSAAPAYAYLDPGTGTIIVQSIIGAVTMATATASIFMTRIKLFFGRMTGKPPVAGERDAE
jgi:hypothetical protein